MASDEVPPGENPSKRRRVIGASQQQDSRTHLAPLTVSSDSERESDSEPPDLISDAPSEDRVLPREAARPVGETLEPTPPASSPSAQLRRMG